MPHYRSRTSTHGRNMAGARGLWRATGMTDSDFGKPIIAVANSFTQFVPGHVHLKDLGQLTAGAIEKAGGVAKEFNTMAVDDGIAMGHDGMLYSLPSRELIADTVEYMCNAHCADAMVCISNCDKITPGMLMAAMRLNIPAIFVSGGPMEAGRLVRDDGGTKRVDLVETMIRAADPAVSDAEARAHERASCPTCGSCSGLFTANSMNCLAEALGLALPGNGSLLATHGLRRELFLQAGREIVALTKRYYEDDDRTALPRGIATTQGFENAITVDIAMGGSTNTILHLLAMAREGDVPFTMADIDRISRKTPNLTKLAPATAQYYMEDFHRAGGVLGLMGELDRLGLLHTEQPTVHAGSLRQALDRWDIMKASDAETERFFRAAPGGERTTRAFGQNRSYEQLDRDRAGGCIRDGDHAYSQDGGLAVLNGNIAPDGCVVKTAAVDRQCLTFTGKARVFESQDTAVKAILGRQIEPGDVVVIRYEGPKGGPGMQEMLYPTSYIKSMGLGKVCALITDGRFSGATSGLSIGHISPEAAAGGTIGLIEEGDTIEIDIPARRLHLKIAEDELERRRAVMNAKSNGWRPVAARPRRVSQALRAYAAFATSASQGAVRDVDQFTGRTESP